MKALSLTQPMAWAIFNGKDIENRRWPTNYRGTILIHASKGFNWDHYAMIAGAPYFSSIPRPEHYDHGVLLGVVRIVDCVRSHESKWFFGPYGFVLEDAREFREHIPYRGALSLFDVPDEIVKEALESCR